jgi:lipopolysaccharide export system protein LptA
MAEADSGIFFLNGRASLIYGRGLKRLFHGTAFRAVGLGLLLPILARAQVLEGPAKKGVHAQYNQKTGKPEWVATYLSASQIAGDTELIQELQLVLFTSEGRSNLVVATPQCVFDLRNKVVSSTNTLQARSVSGGLSLEGQGFECRLADEHLVVSNRVHAVIRKDWLNAPSRTNPPAAARLGSPPAQTNSPGSPAQFLHIYSDRLRYQTNLVLFEGNAHADDPQGRLSAGLLTAEFTEPDQRLGNISEPDQRLGNILAEHNVIIESEGLRATGERANYSATNNVVELTGNPTWRLGGYDGRADELIVNRRTREFHAARNVEMLLPANALGTNGLFWAETAPPTNSLAANKQPIKVNADDFDFRPDLTDTNLNISVLRGHVRVGTEKGNLSCELITIKSTTDKNKTESVVAERHLVMEQGNNRVTGEKAVYTAASDIMEVTGAPAWKMGLREGTAEVLAFDIQHRAYRAMRNVQMKFPAGSFGTSPWLSPKSAGRTSTVAESTGDQSDRASKPRPNMPQLAGAAVEIFADEFEFAPDVANTNQNLAICRGHVLVTDPERMRLSCEKLTGTMPADANQMERVVAERSVELEIHESQREGRARGDKAVYTASNGEVVVTGGDGVQMAFRDPRIDGKGRASTAVYVGETDVLELTGNPVFTTQYGQAWGDVVILDHANATLKATGNWKLHLNAEAMSKVTKSTPQPSASQPGRKGRAGQRTRF